MANLYPDCRIFEHDTAYEYHVLNEKHIKYRWWAYSIVAVRKGDLAHPKKWIISEEDIYLGLDELQEEEFEYVTFEITNLLNDLALQLKQENNPLTFEKLRSIDEFPEDVCEYLVRWFTTVDTDPATAFEKKLTYTHPMTGRLSVIDDDHTGDHSYEHTEKFRDVEVLSSYSKVIDGKPFRMFRLGDDFYGSNWYLEYFNDEGYLTLEPKRAIEDIIELTGFEEVPISSKIISR